MKTLVVAPHTIHIKNNRTPIPSCNKSIFPSVGVSGFKDAHSMNSPFHHILVSFLILEVDLNTILVPLWFNILFIDFKFNFSSLSLNDLWISRINNRSDIGFSSGLTFQFPRWRFWPYDYRFVCYDTCWLDIVALPLHYSLSDKAMKYLFICIGLTWTSLWALLIRMSRPSTIKLALDVFPPATTVYWPASDIFVEAMMRRWTYFSLWIFSLSTSRKQSELDISWAKTHTKS